MADPKELLSFYREVLALGDEMLGILAGPLSGEQVAQLEQAMAQRGQILERCGELVRSTPADEELIRTVQELLRQHKALLQALEGQLERLRQASGASHRARETLKSVQRILNSGSKSRLMDQRR